MIGGARILVIVPARRGSKGLPLKNIRPLGGRPLLAWPIAAARGSRYVDRTIISTDCPEFARLAVEAGADAPFLRPAELAADTSSSASFILHALDTLEAEGETYDYVVLLEPTSPLTEAEDIDSALETLVANRAHADTIVGVTALTAAHPDFVVRIADDGVVEPAYGTLGGSLRRQDCDLLYCLDGSLYVSDVAAFRRELGFYHKRTLPFVTPRWKSLEVDDLVDFICIEAVLANRELVREAERQAPHRDQA